jgi:hypothetical protein
MATTELTNCPRPGLVKANHHGAKAPYRSEAMNRIVALMMAIVMDYRILARYQQEERRATLLGQLWVKAGRGCRIMPAAPPGMPTEWEIAREKPVRA